MKKVLLLIVLLISASCYVQAQKAIQITYTVGNGLNYSYYEGAWNVLPNFDSLTVLKKDTCRNFDISKTRRSENLGFVFTGLILIQRSGIYRFHLGSDDGSTLKIDTSMVVRHDGKHSFSEKSGTINLDSGMHLIEIKYFNALGPRRLSLMYDLPGFVKRVVPDSVLFRRVPMRIFHPVHIVMTDTTTNLSGAYTSASVTERVQGFLLFEDMRDLLNPDMIGYTYLDKDRKPLPKRYCVIRDFSIGPFPQLK